MKALALAVSILLLLLSSCSDEPEFQHGLVVAAPDRYLGGSVLLDGKNVGDLQFLETHGGLFEALLKKIYGDSPAAHVVAVRIDFATKPEPAGRHELRVEKPGLPTATGQFVLPFAGEQVQIFFVNGSKVEPQSTPARANSQ